MKITTLCTLIFSLLFTTAYAADINKPLRTNSMFEESVKVKTVKYIGDMPGENKLLPRGYEGAVPQIPHDMADLAVTEESNDCIMCHDPANEMEGTPLIPETHMANGQVGNDRFFCLLCHVPQAQTSPLVENENDQFIQKK